MSLWDTARGRQIGEVIQHIENPPPPPDGRLEAGGTARYCR